MPKSILQIWALFAAVLVTFICYSSFDKPFKWNFEIKQAPTKQIFNPQALSSNPSQVVIDPNSAGLDNNQNATANIAPNTTTNPENALLPQAEPVAVVDFPKDAFRSYDLRPVVDSSSLYILLAGDSMTEELRHGLAKYCDKNGFKLMTCTWYSSNTQIWSETNRLSQLIAQYRPDLILFTLGSNELFRKDIAERAQYIQDIIYEADRTKTPFVWLNPPAWKEDTGISELIKNNVGAGRHFDSRGIKMGRKSDGAHPTRDGAQVWADTIVKFLKIQSHYKPFFANFSTNLADKVQKTYKMQPLDSVLPARRSKIAVMVLKDTEQNFNPNNTATNNNSAITNNNSPVANNNSTEPSNNSTEPKNNSTEPKNNSTEPKNNSTEPKNNSTEPKNNSTEPKNNSTEPKNNSTEPKNDRKKSDTLPAEIKSNGVKADSSKQR